ncbi:alpha/beta hydrolase family esterase [Pedobacter kyungheensis]|uniref:alpha/beta hydrolase family esterase n=1 Tax=Pedobacter kyungheensis TaxID=1069985 RepID=UPI00068BAE60|nr:prolyl oligopeptidase family serine peptidase [Pedobacter kyungheensis]
MVNKSALRFFGKCFLTALMLVWPVLSRAQEAVKVMKWTVGDTLREAMVYLPSTAKTKESPVIFVFHGHGGTMGNMFRSRGFEKLWPEAIIVYPQGLNTPGQLTDPAGRLPGWQKAPGDMGDRDLHFFDAMLKTLRQDYRVDNKRIYATGHSNGGGFTYLLWATRGDTFAAFAPSAAVAPKVASQLKPKPAMHIMGEQDDLVKTAWQRAMCNKILQVNGCNDKGEPYDQYATLYPSAKQSPVVLYVHPGGHVYPTEANKVVIKFFKSMVKP